MLRVASLVLLVAVLAGCSTQGVTCSGWTQPPTVNNPARMATEERRVSEWIVSTREYGHSVGCW